MFDTCYQKIDYMDLAKRFAVNTEQDFSRLQSYVNDLHARGEIQWKIESKTSIPKVEKKTEVMNTDQVISDMINYVRLNDRIM
jgi:hypothetical protein